MIIYLCLYSFSFFYYVNIYVFSPTIYSTYYFFGILKIWFPYYLSTDIIINLFFYFKAIYKLNINNVDTNPQKQIILIYDI